MDDITIDGVNEDTFRLSIEDMLRHGKADEAARKLRGLIAPYAGAGAILPARFLTATSANISLAGWDKLGERIAGYDRPNSPISAFSIAVTDPAVGTTPTDDDAPRIETSYFSDDAYPFSKAGRGDLLDGYSLHGSAWRGDFETTDTTLSVQGVDDLYGFIARLETRLLDSRAPDPEDIRAGSLGACYLAVLLHQAVRDKIAQDGLPRALCVMAGDDGVYPFFDAPVISSEECVQNGAAERAPRPEAAPSAGPLAVPPRMIEPAADADDAFDHAADRTPSFDPPIPAHQSLLNMRAAGVSRIGATANTPPLANRDEAPDPAPRPAPEPANANDDWDDEEDDSLDWIDARQLISQQSPPRAGVIQPSVLQPVDTRPAPQTPPPAMLRPIDTAPARDGVMADWGGPSPVDLARDQIETVAAASAEPPAQRHSIRARIAQPAAPAEAPASSGLLGSVLRGLRGLGGR